MYCSMQIQSLQRGSNQKPLDFMLSTLHVPLRYTASLKKTSNIARILKAVEHAGLHRNRFQSLLKACAPVICMPRPLVAGNTRDIAGTKCRDLTYDVSTQCRVFARGDTSPLY